MLLDSFRELLIKKSQDVSLQNLIRFLKKDVLIDLVTESLEKMAGAAHKGRAANFAIKDFGAEMDPAHEPAMIRDALSHHASNYKAALKGGNNSVANKHAKQIFRIMDLAEQTQPHSRGKLKVKAVYTQPWERNTKTNQYTADDPKVKEGSAKVGKFKTKTKGWRYRSNNYSFLQQAPHASYAQEVRRHEHNNAYPMEEISINGKHINVDDVETPTSYKPHRFDSHPIMSHFEEPAGDRTLERDKEYLAARNKFNDPAEMGKYFAAQEERAKANPIADSTRGNTRSLPVHKQVDPLDISRESDKAGQPAQAQQAAPGIIRRPAKTDVSKQVLTAEERAKAIALLPPDLRAKLGLE